VGVKKHYHSYLRGPSELKKEDSGVATHFVDDGGDIKQHLQMGIKRVCLLKDTRNKEEKNKEVWDF